MIQDEVFQIIEREKQRQKEELQLIPSENYVSKAVLQAVGSVLMNKYSEGQPGKRYYQGNKNIDELESLCQKRALKVFGLSQRQWSVNVQALSGSPANLAVYNALLKPGEKILSMYLPHGGHLSHGWHLEGRPVTLVSKIYRVGFYKVSPQTKVFDYDQVEKQAVKFKPRLIISGGTAYPREINHQRMGAIAKKVGAFYLADIAHEAGLVAAKLNASPFPYAQVVTMTTHKTLRGPRGALIFSRSSLSDHINRAVFPGLQGGPHNHTIAGIAVCLGEALRPEFKQYAKQIIKNARVLAEALARAGWDLVSGGTDKHLILVDLRSQGLDGAQAALALEKAGIVVNKNTVPFAPGSAVSPAGIRLGVPAVTSRGMKEKEMKKISQLMIRAIKAADDDQTLVEIKAEVKAWVSQFPMPGV
jgi:glycine hydroxymethyltransferase